MCSGCWIEAGRPYDKPDNLQKAVEAIALVYEFSLGGGNLHIHLEDDNLGDEFFEEFELFRKVSPEQEKAERECFEILKKMSEDQRRTVLGIYEGYLQ